MKYHTSERLSRHRVRESRCRSGHQRNYEKNGINIHSLIPPNSDVWTTLETVRSLITGRSKMLSKPNTSKSVMGLLTELLELDCADAHCECLLQLSAVVPRLGDQLNNSVAQIVPKVVTFLANREPEVKIGAMNLLCTCFKHSTDSKTLANLFIQSGLQNTSGDIRFGSLLFVNTLVNVFYDKGAIFTILQALVKQFVDRSSSAHFYSTFCTIKAIHKVIGDGEFYPFLNLVHRNAIELYQNTNNGRYANLYRSTESFEATTKQRNDFCNVPYAFGLLDQVIVDDIKEEDETVRRYGVKSMGKVIRSKNWHLEDIHPHFEDFVKFLGKLMMDTSVQIRILTLDIMDVLLGRMKCELIMHLQVVVRTLVKSLGCPDGRVRKQGAKTIHRLMHYIHPMCLMWELLEKTHSRNPMVREEIINRVTAGLMSFPFYNFDLDSLCRAVSPSVGDFVLSVRQAGIECLVTYTHLKITTGCHSAEITEFMRLACKLDRYTVSAVISRAKNGLLPICGSDGAVCFSNFRKLDTASTTAEVSTCSRLTTAATSAAEEMPQPPTNRSVFTVTSKSEQVSKIAPEANEGIDFSKGDGVYINSANLLAEKSNKNPEQEIRNADKADPQTDCFGNTFSIPSVRNEKKNDERADSDVTIGKNPSTAERSSVKDGTVECTEKMSEFQENVSNSPVDGSFGDSISDFDLCAETEAYEKQSVEKTRSPASCSPKLNMPMRSVSCTALPGAPMFESSAMDETLDAGNSEIDAHSEDSLENDDASQQCTDGEFSYVTGDEALMGGKVDKTLTLGGETSDICEDGSESLDCLNSPPERRLSDIEGSLEESSTNAGPCEKKNEDRDLPGTVMEVLPIQEKNFNIMLVDDAYAKDSDKAVEATDSEYPEADSDVIISISYPSPNNTNIGNSHLKSEISLQPQTASSRQSQSEIASVGKLDDSVFVRPLSNEAATRSCEADNGHEETFSGGLIGTPSPWNVKSSDECEYGSVCNETEKITGTDDIKGSEPNLRNESSGNDELSELTGPEDAIKRIDNPDSTRKRKVKRSQKRNKRLIDSSQEEVLESLEKNKNEIAILETKLERCTKLITQKTRSIRSLVDEDSASRLNHPDKASATCNEVQLQTKAPLKEKEAQQRTKTLITRDVQSIAGQRVANSKPPSRSQSITRAKIIEDHESHKQKTISAMLSAEHVKVSVRRASSNTIAKAETCGNRLGRDVNQLNIQDGLETEGNGGTKSPVVYKEPEVRVKVRCLSSKLRGKPHMRKKTLVLKKRVQEGWRPTGTTVDNCKQIEIFTCQNPCCQKYGTKRLTEVKPAPSSQNTTQPTNAVNVIKTSITPAMETARVMDPNEWSWEYEDNVGTGGVVKLQTGRKASEQWSANIEFPRRSISCPWADSFEEKVATFTPFENDESALQFLKQACEDILLSDILKKEEAMLIAIRVAKFHPKIFSDIYLSRMIVSLNAEMKNLRPSVAGQAVLTIGYLFMLIKKPLENKLRIVIGALLRKSGNRTFAGSYNAVIKSMFYILKGVSSHKAVVAFIQEGARHPNKAVRETAAQFLSLLTDKMGANRCLSSALANQMINTAAFFLMDGSPLTRHCGKLMFSVLTENSNFDNLKKKCLPEGIQLSISKILQNISVKGVEKELLPIHVVWPSNPGLS